MPISMRRAAYFVAVLALFAAPFVRPTAAAGDDLTREQIAQLVLDRYRENVCAGHDNSGNRENGAR